MNGPIVENSNSFTGIPNVGLSKGVRPTDPDVFTDPDSARVRARQLGCIGIRRYNSTTGKYVWKPCTNESDYRREMGISNSGRLQRRREIQEEITRFVRGKAFEEIDEKSGQYTKPGVREKIKNRIMAGSKGGKPGQWSARKAQLLAQEYRKAGGGYKGGKTSKQRSLSKWTKEKWTTSNGKPAIGPKGTRRYLPRAAWAQLTPAQIKANNRKKLQASRSGRQYVSNTDAAMRASQSARKHLYDLQFEQKALGASIGRTSRGSRGIAARFDPNARDADLDKIIQEGTIYERPDTPNVSGPDDAPPRGIPRPDLPNEDDAPPRGIPRPSFDFEIDDNGQMVRKPQEKPTPYRRESIATRMRRVDSGGLTGAVSDDKKTKPAFSAGQTRRSYEEILPFNPVPVNQPGFNRPNPLKIDDSNARQLFELMMEDFGLYFLREGTGDHSIFGKDFIIDDPNNPGKKIIFTARQAIYNHIEFKTLRDEMARKGMFVFPGMPKNMSYEWAKGKSVGEIESTYTKAQKSKLSDAQKSAVKQALGEIFAVGDNNKVVSWAGFMELSLRAQKIFAGPINIEQMQSFVNSRESGEIGRSFREFYLRAGQSNQKIKSLIAFKAAAEKAAKELNHPGFSWLDDRSKLAAVIDRLITQRQENESWFDGIEDAMSFISTEAKAGRSKAIDSDLFKGIDDPSYALGRGSNTEWQLWRDAKELDDDPTNALTDNQKTNLDAELYALQQGDYPEISGDLGLVIGEEAPLDIMIGTGANRSIPSKLLRAISTPDRKINPRYYDYAQWRQNQISAGKWTDQLAEVEASLAGAMSSMGRRGDRTSRLNRRLSSSGLTGAISGEDRRKDYLRKRRIWQSSIIARVIGHNDAEIQRRAGLSAEELAAEPALPFSKWTQKFGRLDVETITGGGGQNSSFSHRVVDQLFNQLNSEWGARETEIFGEKPNFRIYDAPMSAVDIESLSEFKRDIVGTFVEAMKEADPGTPFAKFGAPSTSDEDIDMIWRVYVIPELLKQDSVMPIEELPFDVDPVKQEFIRNYSDYLALKKLGISDSGMSQDDFDRAAQELLVESPAKNLDDFAREINEAYDLFKATGELPGQFTDEDLINPNTGNIYTRDELRQLLDESMMELMKETSNLQDAGQKYMNAAGLADFFFQIGLKLGYLDQEDLDTMQGDIEERREEIVDEIDPLENLDPKDLTFDPANGSSMKSDPRLAWIWRLFVDGGRNWAYPLAERYHASDIQQNRYVRPSFTDPYGPPKTEFEDLSNLDWDKLIELIENASQHGDDVMADLPGVKNLIRKREELKLKRKTDQEKLLKGKTAAAKQKRDEVWNALSVDNLTPEEIAASLDLDQDVVNSVIRSEAKARGVDSTALSNLQRTAKQTSSGREEKYQADLLRNELERIKELGNRSPEEYLSKLREAQQYYKDVEKQANAAYSQARRRYAELQTMAYWLLQGLPDGTKDFDPKKESAVAFKNRWLIELQKIQEPLARIANAIDSMQWNNEDRISASSRILDRAKHLSRSLNGEIEKTEKVLKISERDALLQRHKIQALSKVREAARQAARGIAPNLSDDEIDSLLGPEEGGLTGAMKSSMRKAKNKRGARQLLTNTSQNVGDNRGLLRRVADLMPGMKSSPKLMAIAEAFDKVPDMGPRISPRAITRNRNRRGINAAPDIQRSRLSKLEGMVSRAIRDGGVSRGERSMVRGIERDAKRAKINIKPYFDDDAQTQDVLWSTNDWSISKKQPIRGADIVVYRRNPNALKDEEAIEVLVIERSKGPFTGSFALPGGLNDEGETLVETAMREMQEEVGISADNMRVRNLGIVQSSDWDPRFVGGVTVQGMSVRVPYGTEATAGSDAKKATFVPLSRLLSGDRMGQDGSLAFGHATFLREALESESPSSAKKFAIHERASRVRNRRLLEKVNSTRSEINASGTNRASVDGNQRTEVGDGILPVPLFEIPSDEEIKNGYEIIRPNNPGYKNLNDPSSGLTGALSERYDIRPNGDGTFNIVDTQNNNMRIAGPFASRKQALYGAIRKDRDPSFDPQILLGRGKGKGKATKKSMKRVVKKQEPKQLSLFDENDTANRLDQSPDGGLTGAISTTEFLQKLGMGNSQQQTMPEADLRRGMNTNTAYSGPQMTDPLSQKSYNIDRARYDSVWVPYRDGVSAMVPDSEATATPTIYIIGGPPGSLKSTIREAGVAGIPTREQAITIDPDEAKQIMPEFMLGVEASPKITKIADQTHEESKEIVQNALIATINKETTNLKVMGKAKDIVYDSSGQMRDRDIYEAIKDARAKGYKVVGLYFHAPDQILKQRIKLRQKQTGRSVSASHISGTNSGINSILADIMGNGYFDSLAMYDTTYPSKIQRVGLFVRDRANPPAGFLDPADIIAMGQPLSITSSRKTSQNGYQSAIFKQLLERPDGILEQSDLFNEWGYIFRGNPLG